MELIIFLIIVFIVVALEGYIYRRWSVSNIKYDCRFEKDEVSEGDTVIFIEKITNAKFLPVPWLKSEITTSKWLEFAELQSSVTDKTRFVSSFFMLKSYHRVVRRWNVKCVKRGVFNIEKVVLVATDLLGSVNVSLPVEINAKLTVLPVPVFADKQAISVLQLYGDRTVFRNIVPDNFYHNGIKEYDESNPTQRINWLATAKRNEIMVFGEEYTSSKSVALVLNFQSKETDINSLFSENSIEKCIKFCTAVSCECFENNIPVSFLCNTKGADGDTVYIPMNTGAEHNLRLLRAFAGLEFDSPVIFERYLFDIVNFCNTTDIYIVTSYLNSDIISFQENNKNVKLFTLSGKFDANIINISGLFREEGGAK